MRRSLASPTARSGQPRVVMRPASITAAHHVSWKQSLHGGAPQSCESHLNPSRGFRPLSGRAVEDSILSLRDNSAFVDTFRDRIVDQRMQAAAGAVRLKDSGLFIRGRRPRCWGKTWRLSRSQ